MAEPKPVDSRVANELLLAGQLSGMAMKVRIDILQAYLDSKPEGFKYGDVCKKVLDLARMVQGR